MATAELIKAPVGADLQGMNAGSHSWRQCDRGEAMVWARAPNGARLRNRTQRWCKNARFNFLSASAVCSNCLTDSRAEGNRVLERRKAFALEETRQVPYAWVGSVAEICEGIESKGARWGVGYRVVPEPAIETMAPVAARMVGRYWPA